MIITDASDILIPATALPRSVARIVIAFTVLGILVAVAGLALALAVQDRFLGFALLIVGAFLMFLPHTRPYLDE